MKKEPRVPDTSDRRRGPESTGETRQEHEIDAILKTAFQRRAGTAPAEATPACLDAERLSAWVDGAFSAGEAAAVELHVSTCARCQSLVAAFARSAPAPAAVVPLRRPGPVRWLAPIATLAAAATLTWFVWPATEQTPADVGVMTRQESPPQPSVVPSAPVPPPPSEPPAATARDAVANPASKLEALSKERAATGERARVAQGGQGRGVLGQTAPPPAAGSDASRPAQAVAPPSGAVTPPLPPPVMAAQPPPPSPPPPPPATPLPARATAPPVATPPPPPAITMDSARSSTLAPTDPLAVVAEFSSAEALLAETATGGGGGGGGRGGAGGRGGGTAAATVQSQALRQAPVPIRWRVLAGGGLDRSTDSGTTWIRVTLDPLVHVIGGTAPLPQVCWLIGRGGVVLRSVDAATRFERVASPEMTTEIASIRATNALIATVTTVTGRVFMTIDGGATWRLQGFPGLPF